MPSQAIAVTDSRMPAVSARRAGAKTPPSSGCMGGRVTACQIRTPVAPADRPGVVPGRTYRRDGLPGPLAHLVDRRLNCVLDVGRAEGTAGGLYRNLA